MSLQHWRPPFGPSCTEFLYPGCWHFDNDATSKIDNVMHFDNGATSKIDNVLIEHGGLPHVLPLAVHLAFSVVDK